MIKKDAIIIGAGPVGLFGVHQLGIKGLNAVVIDNLDKAGGQCIELYPDKPIYDIPGVPECTGEELTNKLLEQIKPFKTSFVLNERVDEIRQEKDSWFVKTNKNKEFFAPNIIIAGGVGSFEPRKLSLKNLEKYEGKSIFYAVKNKDEFKNKNISIFGGGDSALDWALELSKFSRINLIHRRNEFRGAPHTLSEIKKLEKEGKVSIKTPCQLESIEEDGSIKSITIKFEDGKTEKLNTDIILSFFGLVMKLGPIAEWGLNMNKKTIKVNAENFETNKKGIFAVGDICSYPGKLKLILSGFHEVALASVECFKRARPNEKYRFEFTTSQKLSKIDLEKMIELLTADTPNGKKISIMLEEIKFKYKITKINLYKDEQFKPEFKKLSPFKKIPVIIDHKANKSLFESGAILIYLGEKSGMFYDQDQRSEINQWLMGQMAYVGPMLGQHHQFHYYNPGKSEFGEKRYFKIALQIYNDLDESLLYPNF